MRLPEQKFWDRTRRKLSTHLLLERIENLLEEGTPDLVTLAPNGRVVRLELKTVEGYPARSSTPILGDKGLSLDQRNWHMAWNRAGGTSAILVGVGSYDQFLVHGRNCDIVNSLNRNDLVARGCILAFEWINILRWLRENDEN